MALCAYDGAVMTAIALLFAKTTVTFNMVASGWCIGFAHGLFSL
jgi:hypothetical protein